MGLLDSISHLFYGDEKDSLPPQYTPYQAPVPQYQPTQRGQQQTDQLGDVLRGRLNAYQRGGSTLDPAYRAAVLGNATNEANQAAEMARNQLGEQLNKWGLLNSSAAGYGLGLIGKQQQLSLQNAANYLTEQDLSGLNALTGQSQAYGNAQNAVAGQQLGAQQFGYNAGLEQNEQAYNSQLARSNARNQQRNSLLGGLFGLGKAALLSNVPGGGLLSGLFGSGDRGIAEQNGANV